MIRLQAIKNYSIMSFYLRFAYNNIINKFESIFTFYEYIINNIIINIVYTR